MKKHEAIRSQYRLNRYMECLSAGELEQRARDILLNIITLEENNKIGVHSLEEEGEHWFTIWTHLLEEFCIRYGPYPSGFTNGFLKEVRMPNPSHEKAIKACKIIEKLCVKSDRYLFKYGEYEWLEEMLKKGTIRISPASRYSDPSLNSAIQDDELKKIIHQTNKADNLLKG